MMQARRSLAVLLSAAGASVSAGAGYLYLGDDHAATPSTAAPSTAGTTTKIHRPQPQPQPHEADPAGAKSSAGRRRPLRATTKKDLGWEQSLARDLACWISSASVFTATQVLYAAAPAASDLLGWRSTNATSSPGGDPQLQIPTHQQLLTLGELPLQDAEDAQGDAKRRRTTATSPGLYHALLGWLQELDPQHAGDWHADRVIQSASFNMLLNGLSGGADELRRDLAAELLRAVGLLAANEQCAAAIAQRATRYGKQALLNVAQQHDADPRLGQALQRLVGADAGAALRFGPANLLSLVALAVADDVPDEYLTFALWALARAASPAHGAQQRRSYAWRKTLFGDDAAAKTRRKLVANDGLWHALARAGAASARPLDVQRQVAALLSELSEDLTPATAARFKKHLGTLDAVVQWVSSADAALACAALQTVANVASDKGLRAQLVALDALDAIRARVQHEGTKSNPQLTVQLLRAVRSLARPATGSASEPYALDRDALSFVGGEDDDVDHPLHHDDLLHPSAARKHQYVDGWIELFAALLRSDHTEVRAEAALCLEQVASCGAHQDQGVQEWLIAVLDGVLEQVPAAVSAASTSVRAAKSRTRPMVGQRKPLGEHAASHAKALRALAFVAGRAECQQELVRRGGVPLLKLLLASSNTQVQRETARVLANLFTCDALEPALAEFASHDEQLTRVLDAWTTSSDAMLRSLAHRARSNRRYQHNRLQHADESDVKYLDNVHPLHFSTSPAFHSEDPAELKENKEMPVANDQYDVDVVFIHGLLGCPYETWVCGDDESTVWAEKWLLEDLKAEGRNPRVLSVGYDSQLLASESAWRTMCFEETSQEVLQKLQAARVGDSGRPVVFVTHSLGGVVLKQVLLESEASAGSSSPGEPSASSASSLADSVRGVVFYGVPHHGSPVAQTIQAFRPRTLGIQQHPVTAHLHGTPHLKMLNDWCADLFEEKAIAAISISESVPCRLPLIGVDALVVPPASANPGFGEFVCVEDADHVDVCKPRSKQDVRYTLAKDFITRHVPVDAVDDEDMMRVD